MAQHAIRRLDHSPHPLLSDWNDTYKGKAFRSHWRYPSYPEDVNGDEPRIDAELPDRVPSMDVCFGPPVEREYDIDDVDDDSWYSRDTTTWYSRDTTIDDGQMIMPDEFSFDKHQQPFSRTNVFSSSNEDIDMLHYLSQHVAWIAEHGREGSRRRQLASEGIPPFVFLAKDGIGRHYRTFWAIALDHNDEPMLCFLAPDELSSRPIEQLFNDANVPDVNSWFFARSDGDQWSWLRSHSIKYDLLQWATLAKTLQIRPFAETKFLEDPLAILDALSQEDEVMKLRRRHDILVSPHHAVDLNEEPKAVIEYFMKLELVVKDDE